MIILSQARSTHPKCPIDIKALHSRGVGGCDWKTPRANPAYKFEAQGSSQWPIMICTAFLESQSQKP